MGKLRLRPDSNISQLLPLRTTPKNFFFHSQCIHSCDCGSSRGQIVQTGFACCKQQVDFSTSRVSHSLWTSRLSGAYSHRDVRSTRRKLRFTSTFQVFACVTLVNISVVKVSQMAEPSISGTGKHCSQWQMKSEQLLNNNLTYPTYISFKFPLCHENLLRV